MEKPSANTNSEIAVVAQLDEAAIKAEKKAFAKAKRDHDLHVSLIMRTDELSKPNAIVQAWREGDKGLSKRLDK